MIRLPFRQTRRDFFKMACARSRCRAEQSVAEPHGKDVIRRDTPHPHRDMIERHAEAAGPPAPVQQLADVAMVVGPGRAYDRRIGIMCEALCLRDAAGSPCAVTWHWARARPGTTAASIRTTIIRWRIVPPTAGKRPRLGQPRLNLQGKSGATRRHRRRDDEAPSAKGNLTKVNGRRL